MENIIFLAFINKEEKNFVISLASLEYLYYNDATLFGCVTVKSRFS